MTQLAFGSGDWFVTPLLDAAGNAIAAPTPIKIGVLQDCSIDLSADTKELYGQGQFPIDISRGKAKISGKAKFAQILARMWNATLIGQTVGSGQTLKYEDFTGATIPTTPFTITPTMPGSGTWVGDLGVADGPNGVPYQRVASGPTTGQYSVSSGVYTFASADAGKKVFIRALYTVTGGNTIQVANLPMGFVPTFKSDIFLFNKGQTTRITLPNTVCGKLSLATKQDDYTIPEVEFQAFADSSGTAYIIGTAE